MAKVSPVNVFTPADEVRDTQRFAGRSRELQTLSNALDSDGVQIVIYGNRGVGKSSLARQLERLAQNDAEVRSRLDYAPQDGFDFLTIYFRCDDSVRDIPRLLLRLLTDDSALAPWVPFKVVAKERTDTLSGKIDVKIFSVGGDKETNLKEAAQELEADVVSVFSNALQNITRSKVARDGVLLIIDEFDRIRDRAGLASLLKVLGPQDVTFALVGVSTNIEELITEHESVARQLSDGAVHVPPMTDDEMHEIFDRAEDLLEKRFTFSRDARTWIIEVAKGHPFYVHLIGKHALLKTVEQRQAEVSRDAAVAALKEIALKGSAPIQESLYKTAIGNSYVREYVLKTFAAQNDDEIYTTSVYPGIARTLGIDPSAISVYVGQLSSDKYGDVLQKTRDRYYRFRDSLFKAYAAARPWQFAPGDQEDPT